MKRVFAILTILFLLLMPVTVFAASKTYEIPEMHMRIDIPEELMVFSRDVEADDPNLAVLGSDEKSLEQLFMARNIYLNAIQTDPVTEILVIMIEYDGSKDIFDFNKLSDAEFDAIYRESANSEEAKQNKLTYTGYTVYKHAQATFMKMSLHQPNGETEAYGIQYYTIINGKAINVTLHSYHGEPTQADESLVKNAVDSVYFTQVKAKPQQDSSVGAFTSQEDQTNGSQQAESSHGETVLPSDKISDSRPPKPMSRILEKALGGAITGLVTGGVVAIWAAIKRRRKRDEQE